LGGPFALFCWVDGAFLVALSFLRLCLYSFLEWY